MNERVKGRGAGSLIGLLPRGARHVALLLSGLVPCGMHGHLPGCEGPGETGEQGQNGVECSHSILKETCADETLVSFLSSAGWDSAQPGEGPSLSPAVVCTPTPPPPLQLSWFHQSQPKLAGGGGQGEKRPLACVWLR